MIVQYKYVWVSVFHLSSALCVCGLERAFLCASERERERESAPVPEIVVVSFRC